MIFIGIIVAIIMFSLIIIAHEYGHFKTARIFGVKVEEFGLGIPPRAKKLFKDKKGTLYSLNRLPLGGFVKLKGENPHLLKNKEDKDALINKNYFQQSTIILGGVFMNFLLAFIIFSILFMVGVKPIGINNKIETSLDNKLIPTYEQAVESGLIMKKEGIVLYPIENSIAYNSGIKEKDILVEINNKEVTDINEVRTIISNSREKELIFLLKRGEDLLKINIIPSNEGKIGSYLSENIELNEDFIYKYGFIDSIKYGYSETKNQILLTFQALGILGQKIFNPKTETEREEAINEISGPIGMVDMISKSLAHGIIFIIIIGAIISINLGVFNLLPIPALDGGRFVFITINSFLSTIFRKKVINENIESYFHAFFLIILIILSVFIAYNDITKIINS